MMKSRNFHSLFLFYVTVSVSQALMLQPQSRVRLDSRLFSSAVDARTSVKDALLSATLNKASKTLAIVIDYERRSSSQINTEGDLSTLSMQLRKVNAAALVTSDLEAATVFVKEQSTATGNFPGPCPVIYSGENIQGAIEAGVDAIVVDSCNQIIEDVCVIRKVSSVQDVSHGSAFLVEADNENIEGILSAIPAGSIVIASMKSMQGNNAELQRGKELKALGFTAILLEKASIGDSEDVEYASFAIMGLTKKKSSTFNLSGLTGSTNGHFGGVASSSATTWLRMRRKQE